MHTTTKSNPFHETDAEQIDTNPIISLDPSTPLDPKPLIADILRTGYCIPGSVFLVESIERKVRVLSPSSGDAGSAHGRHRRHDHHYRRRPKRTVRLLLGDGELCIQAFARGEIHCFVDGGSVYEGCYVRLDKFSLESVEVEVGGDRAWGPEGLEGQRTKGGEKIERVVYLVVGDMVTVGWNEEYLALLRREAAEEEDGRSRDRAGEKGGADGEFRPSVEESGGNGLKHGDDLGDNDEELIELLMKEGPGKSTATGPEPSIDDKDLYDNPTAGPSKQPSKRDTDEVDEADYLSDSDSAFETLTISAERADQRRVTASAPDPRQELQAAIIKQNHQHPPQRQQQHLIQQGQHRQYQPQPQPKPANLQPPPNPKPRPWLPTTATHPLKLTPLSQIPKLPYRQNWMINVLAILTSLSPTEPSHIGPSFVQRTARLSDTSTPSKQIHLTVYLDPEGFTPREGGVVLLMGVKNHLFEGGSLRKYVSDSLPGGGSWWVGDGGVEGLPGWCAGEVGRLRGWWAEKVKEEGG